MAGWKQKIVLLCIAFVDAKLDLEHFKDIEGISKTYAFNLSFTEASKLYLKVGNKHCLALKKMDFSLGHVLNSQHLE